MNKTIGIVGVTSDLVAYPTAYFLDEYYSYATSNNICIPRIIIENLTSVKNMSSPFLNPSQRSKIVSMLGKALENMIEANVNRVTILCNMAHLYLEDVLSLYPKVFPYYINLIDGVVSEVKSTNIQSIMVLCTKNVKETGLYNRYFLSAGISVIYADKYADRIVSLIEAVERNSIYADIELELIDICSDYKDYGIYFACTELSMIYGRNKKLFSEFKIFDTIDIAIKKLSLCMQK